MTEEQVVVIGSKKRTSVTVYEDTKQTLDAIKNELGFSSYDETLKHLTLLHYQSKSLNSYESTKSNTKAFFDGLFESLKDHKDTIIDLAKGISEAFNPIPHAIARAIDKATDAIVKKFENGEIGIDQLVSSLLPLFELYLQATGKGTLVNSLRALFLKTDKGTFAGVSLDHQETSQQGRRQNYTQQVNGYS